MKKIHIGIAIVGVLSTVAILPGRSVIAQQPACLHGTGETPAQQMRRRQALVMARQINTAQAAARQRTKAYQSLTGLERVGAAPEGFVARIAVDENAYAFSINDSTDPCGFAFFSDQDGLIYTGEALR